MSAQPPVVLPDASAPPSTKDRSIFWILGVLVAIAACTAFALLQSGRRDPITPPTRWEAFWTPRETNPFRRYPFYRSELRAVETSADGKQAWATGTLGLIMYSTDGGTSWKTDTMPDPGTKVSGATEADPTRRLSDLVSIAFADASNGVAAGGPNIYHTTDGGRTWSPSVWPGRGDSVASAVVNQAGDGVAASTVGVLQTGDRGRTWRLGTVRKPMAWVGMASGGSLALSVDRHVFGARSGGAWGDVTPAVAAVARGRPTAAAVVGNIAYVATRDASGRIDLLRSDNMGGAWRRQVVLRAHGTGWGGVRRMRFVTPDTGWITNDLGNLYRTANAGLSWQFMRSGIVDFAFSDRDSGYAISSRNEIWVTKNGGGTWRLVAAAPAFRAMAFVNEHNGIAVGHGLVARTRDGGATWRTGAARTTGNLNTLWYSRDPVPLGDGRLTLFWDRVALAGGERGTIWHTRNDGSSWSVMVRLPTNRPIIALGTVGGDEPGFFAATDSGEVFRPGFGGWRRVGVVPDPQLRSLTVLGNRTCIAIGRQGLWKSVDECRTWKQLLPSPFNREITAAHFRSDSLGWAARPRWMLTTKDGGVTWDSASLGTRDRVNAIAFVSPDVGWAVGRNAQVWGTQTGGESWERYPVAGVDTSTGRIPDLLTLAVSGDTLVRAAGDGGIVVAGGRNSPWRVIVARPSRSPALWYRYAVALCLVLFFFSLRLKPPAEVVGPKDMFVSDRALRPGDRDLLDFEEIAKGLSRFLRNTRTEPPLTLAVTGVWGHGKSSLMNLVREDLKRHKQRVVWFNAWDHENEENLLASLLAAVQAQGVPGILNPWAAVVFRVRLVLNRAFAESPRGGARSAARLAGVAFLVAVTIVLSAPAATARFLRTFAGILTAVTSADAWQRWLGALDTAARSAGTVKAVVLVSSLVTFGVALIRSLRAFGVKPGSLLAPVSRAARLRDLDKSTGFRHQFAQDFQSVTAALGKSRLVIFIDDLDRCRPESIRTVLEAVNFLSQAGDCLIVLGFDSTIVKRDVYRFYLKAAKDARELDPEHCGDPRKAHEEAQAHADGFFDKLINIEVRLPVPAAATVATILDPDTEEAKAVALSAGRKRRGHVMKLGVGALLVVALTRLLLTAEADPPASLTQVGTAEQIAVQEPMQVSGFTQPRRITVDTLVRVNPDTLMVPRRPAGFVPSSRLRYSLRWVWWVLGIGLTILLYHFVAREGPEIKDSTRFVAARDAWAPRLARILRTPRDAKRFLNRLRYYAMMFGGEPQESGRRAKVNRFLRRPWVVAALEHFGYEPPRARPSSARTLTPIPDELLVAYAAIEALEPTRLQDDDSSAELIRDVKAFLAKSYGREVADTIQESPQPGEAASYLERFRVLSGTITAH